MERKKQSLANQDVIAKQVNEHSLMLGLLMALCVAISILAVFIAGVFVLPILAALPSYVLMLSILGVPMLLALVVGTFAGLVTKFIVGQSLNKFSLMLGQMMVLCVATSILAVFIAGVFVLPILAALPSYVLMLSILGAPMLLALVVGTFIGLVTKFIGGQMIQEAYMERNQRTLSLDVNSSEKSDSEETKDEKEVKGNKNDKVYRSGKGFSQMPTQGSPKVAKLKPTDVEFSDKKHVRTPLCGRSRKTFNT